MTFAHLNCHTEFSISDSVIKIDRLMEAVKSKGMTAVAMTDKNNCFGALKFYRSAVRHGIKPIIGAEITLRHHGVLSTCVILCINNDGFLNLRKILSLMYVNRTEADVCCEWSYLLEHKKGLLVLASGVRSEIGLALISGDDSKARVLIQEWQAAFSDCFYLAVQRVGRPNEALVFNFFLQQSVKYSIPIVATNDVCFLDTSDFQAHEARVCIHDGYLLEDSRREKHHTQEQYLASPSDMADLYQGVDFCLQNAAEIVKRCTVEIEFGRVCLPIFSDGSDTLPDDLLSQYARAGLDERIKKLEYVGESERPDYVARLQRELGVIQEMGFSSYFLIVADFIQWAKDHDIPVGPGRGSGAGSLVAYVLGITELDPLAYDLLFERFLNPERVSMPDFDVDFCMSNRDRVIQYVSNRYGESAVSQIITYGTMAAKAVIRDVGRVLGFPYGFVDRLAKLIPFEIGMTLAKALVSEPVLAARYREEEEVRQVIDLAKKLEGLVRNAGKHAGGVVIAPTDLTDFVPLYREMDSTVQVTQFDKDDVESIGLVKFDFLGLRTLTIIHQAIKHIKQRLGKEIDINLIPLDDQPVYELIKRCETTAVFQLESRGMKDLIQRLKPDSFSDLVALVALFRPGPLQSGMVDDFIERKQGRAEVNYFHPELESILAPTYGVILYQEQVMQIAQQLAGYTLGAADLLRRAMGKKKPEAMKKQRDIFMSGATGRGVDAALAKKIFDLMEKFAGYGFNKSHSAAYALIAYQTAWLKTHYPAEFMASVLSSDMDTTDKVLIFINDVKSMGLTLLPPDIHESNYPFCVTDDGAIRYGLGAVKGVGEGAVECMVAERQENGPYTSLANFCSRLETSKISRRTLEPLILSGAMDGFGQTRATLMGNLNRAIKLADQYKRDQQAGQDDLFAVPDQPQSMAFKYDPMVDEYDRMCRLDKERVALGFYYSGHPMTVLRSELSSVSSATTQTLTVGEGRVIAGLVLSKRMLTTKRGKRMGVFSLEDECGQMDVTMFSEAFHTYFSLLSVGDVVLVKGKAQPDKFTDRVGISADQVLTLDDVRAKMGRRLVIQLRESAESDVQLSALREALQAAGSGSCRVQVCLRVDAGAKGCYQLGDDWRVQPSAELLTALYRLFDEDSVQLAY